MLSALLAILLMAPSAAGLRDEGFTLVMPVSPETEEGARLIARRAIEICRGKYPKLGRYRFKGSEPAKGSTGFAARFEVRMELSCLDGPPEVASAEPAPADWKPSIIDEKMAAEMTHRYFALVDAGDGAGVHALWSRANQEMTPLPERQVSIRKFREVAGVPTGHRILKLTWYVNPQGAPGVHVAVDYERTYRGLAFNCGYLVWFREPSGRLVLIREETNFLTRKVAESFSVEKVAEARALMRCPAA
jgi:hypothetical protein